MSSSFVSGSTNCNEPNELDLDTKGSMLEALERYDSDPETQYNGGDPDCDSLPVAGTSGSVDDFMSMQPILVAWPLWFVPLKVVNEQT